jgi:hypothetical protein
MLQKQQDTHTRQNMAPVGSLQLASNLGIHKDSLQMSLNSFAGSRIRIEAGHSLGKLRIDFVRYSHNSR